VSVCTGNEQLLCQYGPISLTISIQSKFSILGEMLGGAIDARGCDSGGLCRRDATIDQSAVSVSVSGSVSTSVSTSESLSVSVSYRSVSESVSTS